MEGVEMAIRANRGTMQERKRQLQEQEKNMSPKQKRRRDIVNDAAIGKKRKK